MLEAYQASPRLVISPLHLVPLFSLFRLSPSLVLRLPHLANNLIPTQFPQPTTVLSLLLSLHLLQQAPQTLDLPITIHHLPLPDLDIGDGACGDGAGVVEFLDEREVDGFEAVVLDGPGVQEGGVFCEVDLGCFCVKGCRARGCNDPREGRKALNIPASRTSTLLRNQSFFMRSLTRGSKSTIPSSSSLSP